MSAMATTWRIPLLLAGASVGAKVSIATPERYGLNPVIVTMAKAIAEQTKAQLRIYRPAQSRCRSGRRLHRRLG